MFSDTLRPEGRHLKSILSYLYCNKFNKVNIRHPYTHNYISHKYKYHSLINLGNQFNQAVNALRN